METIRRIIKLIITLILIILIIGMILLNLISETLQKEYILRKLEETNYYETKYQEVQENFDNYILQSGLEEKALEGICSKEQVEEDTKKIIQNIFEGTENKVGTENIKEKLNQNIEEQLSTVIVTENTKKAIKQLVDTIGQEYEMQILQNKYDQKINTIINKFNEQIKAIKSFAFTALLVIITLLVVANIKTQKAKTLSDIGIAILAVGLLLILANIFINTQIKIENITVLSQSISEVLRNILKEIINKIIIEGSTMIILGCMAIIVGNSIAKKK